MNHNSQCQPPMNPTPATTAPQFHTTPKTEPTASAPTVVSGTNQRIDAFIKRKLAEAGSADGCGISDSAARAARLGFVNAANVRYSAFLEAFRSSPLLTETYQEKYPSSLFLPWTAFHVVLKALDLWVDLPEHYMGAVPPEQLPWMEIFELEASDGIHQVDVPGLLDTDDKSAIALVQEVLHRVEDPSGIYSGVPAGLLSNAAREVAHNRSSFFNQMIRDRWAEAQDSFFVVAPKEAFRSKVDWLTRFRRLTQDALTDPKVTPDDPLVIRFCRGGCLVVAAWGEEASALNAMTRDLKL